MKRRWIRITALALVLPLLLAAALLVFVLNSQAGAQWTLDRLTAMSETDIRYSLLEGTLLDGLSLTQFRYRDEGQQAEIDRLEVKISWPELMGGTLLLKEVRANRIRHQVTGPGSGDTGLQLDLPQWAFTICVGQLQVDEVRSGEGEALVILEAVTAGKTCLEGGSHQLNIESVALVTKGVQFEAVQLEAKVRGAVPLTASVAWQYPEQGWSGSGPVSGSLELLELQQQVSGPYPFELNGTLAPFHDPAPLLDVRATWHAWQLEDVVLPTGQAQLKGVLDNYALSYQFDALVPDVPALQVIGTGDGNLDGLVKLDATAQSEIGSVRYEGWLDWSQQIRSEGTLKVSGFDPAWLSEDLSGSVDGTSAMVLLENEDTRFAGFELHGMVNGNEVKLRGDAQAGPAKFRCQSCRLLAGRNEVRFDGVVDERKIDAELEIRAPDLAALWPGLDGRFNAEGSLAGSINSPVFTGRAGGTDLAYGGWTLARVNISSGSASEQEIRFSLTAEDLRYRDLPPALVTAQASGTLQALDLALDWTSSGLNAALRSSISLDADGIEATIHSAQLSESQTGTWALDDPFGLQSNADGTVATASRWRNGDSEVSIHAFSQHNEETAIRATLNNWSLQNLQPLLPENQQLRGTAEAEVDVVYQGGNWSGTVGWRQSGTLLLTSVPGNVQAEIRVPRAQLDILLENGGAVATAHLDIEPDVRAELSLQADKVASDANIDGNILFTGQDWSWVSAVVPELDRLDGDISANVQLSGPLMTPNIRGSLDWKRGRLMIPALNIMLDEVDLSMAGEPNGGASLKGSARAGEGRLEFEGRFEQIMTPQRSARVSITGDTAELLNWPEYHVWVSPDIDIQSHEEGWELRGKLDLPRANVQLRDLPENAVTISEDVRVLGAEEPALRPTRYFGEARVSLGDQVRVQLLGLDTRLSGDLLIRVPRGRPPTATGQVNLVEGTFEAYGQKLQIEQGTLLFTGPFDNPVVDVRAVRVIETFDGPVTAGIHLQGRALSLSSRVYSVPAMAEADALSYLVIGRPLSQVSDAESADVSNAAIALGLGQASRITQQIGDRLGLDQLNLIGDGGEGTALVAGKQINKRLYARYAYGVFSRLGTILLRYKLSRRVAIEAASGERQSLDILYTVEKQ